MNFFLEMFKTFENFNFNTKCAEIHYSMLKFSIICLSCQQRWHDYGKFIQHFQEEHTDEAQSSSPLGNLQEEISVKKEKPIYYEQEEQWMLKTLVEEENDEDDNSKCGQLYNYMEGEGISEPVSLLK